MLLISLKYERGERDLRLVYIGLRKGGPTLNTAATKIYWKQDIRNRAEFS